MKNSSAISIKNSLTVSLFATAFFFASCKKDDFIPAPSGIDVKTNTEKQISGAQVEEAVSVSGLSKKFTLIRIDRISASNDASDYSIAVGSDAWVTFTARDDGSGMGAKKWKLPDSRFAELKRYLENATATFELVHQSVAADAQGAKLSICYAPAADEQVKLISADFKTAPGFVIDLKNNVERMLNIPPYLHLDTDVHAIADSK